MVYSAKDFRVRRIVEKKERENKIIRIKKRLLFSTLILLLLLVSGFYLTTYADANNLNVVKYHVQSGDTLWQIAAQYDYGSKDIREVIFNIKKINNLKSGFISTGQILEIPRYDSY